MILTRYADFSSLYKSEHNPRQGGKALKTDTESGRIRRYILSQDNQTIQFFIFQL